MSCLRSTATSAERPEIWKKYSSSAGRNRVQTTLLPHAPKSLTQEFDNLSVVLKYWRDEASHGKASQIQDNEAFTSRALLLRFAQFVHEQRNPHRESERHRGIATLGHSSAVP